MSGNDLFRSALLDCHGRTTHELTLLPDGTVSVRTGSLVVVVDPARRVVLRPRGAHLPDQVLGHAVALASEARPELHRAPQPPRRVSTPPACGHHHGHS